MVVLRVMVALRVRGDGWGGGGALHYVNGNQAEALPRDCEPATCITSDQLPTTTGQGLSTTAPATNLVDKDAKARADKAGDQRAWVIATAAASAWGQVTRHVSRQTP